MHHLEPPAAETQPSFWRSPRLRRLLRIAAVLLLVLLACLAAFAAWIRHAALAALPQLDGTIIAKGLSSPVTVLRDAHGVPAITASSLEDLFFAQGYVTAQDRLWQMDMSRRFAAGELAAILGGDYVQTDTAQRILGLRPLAERTAAHLPPPQRAYFEAYARGVNAYVAAHRDSLPLEFRILRYSPRPWTPADSFLIGAMMSEMLNERSHFDELAREKIVARLGPERAADLFPVTTGRDILPDGERPQPATEIDEEVAPVSSQAQPGQPHAAHLFPQSSSRDVMLSDSARSREASLGSATPRAVSGFSLKISQPLLVSKRSRDSSLAARAQNDTSMFDRATGAGETAGFRPCGSSPWETINAGAEALPVFGDNAARLKSCPDTVGFALSPGSNNWVLSGAHTASGEPLLANDMHLPHRIPDTWYELHLTSGTFDVVGVSLPGVPCIIVGHNRRIAWGFTNLGPDVQDLYIETFNQRGEYLTPQGWQKPLVRREVIHVKHGRDRTIDVVVTRHGPIITPALRRESRQLALRWTLYDSITPANATKTFAGGPDSASGSFPFFDLNAAGNWEEFRRALSQMASPGQNVVYADVDGHIGYQATGLIPIRASGDGTLPVSGSDDVHEWQGYIPFDELPRLFDPPSGIIATANNRVVPDDYPHLITTDWAGPYRAERIHHVLASGKKFTRADMLELQTDVYSDLDHFLAERFVYAIDHWPQASPRARQAAALLRQWDGRMAADSAAAAIERHARLNLYETLLQGKLGDDATRYRWMNSGSWLEHVVLHSPPNWLPPGYAGYDELLAAMVEKAVNSSQAPSTLADWRYGHDFPVEIAHPIFSKVPILKWWAEPGLHPQSGSGDTVKQVGRAFGPSQRMTVDFSDLDASTLNVVYGESGNLFSPYFGDQWQAWYAGTTFTLPFSKTAVEGSAAHRLILKPE